MTATEPLIAEPVPPAAELAAYRAALRFTTAIEDAKAAAAKVTATVPAGEITALDVAGQLLDRLAQIAAGFEATARTAYTNAPARAIVKCTPEVADALLADMPNRVTW